MDKYINEIMDLVRQREKKMFDLGMCAALEAMLAVLPTYVASRVNLDAVKAEARRIGKMEESNV